MKFPSSWPAVAATAVSSASHHCDPFRRESHGLGLGPRYSLFLQTIFQLALSDPLRMQAFEELIQLLLAVTEKPGNHT